MAGGACMNACGSGMICFQPVCRGGDCDRARSLNDVVIFFNILEVLL